MLWRYLQDLNPLSHTLDEVRVANVGAASTLTDGMGNLASICGKTATKDGDVKKPVTNYTPPSENGQKAAAIHAHKAKSPEQQNGEVRGPSVRQLDFSILSS